MKGIYFASFYFRVWDLTREIRENKNPAKISTYTVYQPEPEAEIVWANDKSVTKGVMWLTALLINEWKLCQNILKQSGCDSNELFVISNDLEIKN